MKTWSLSEVNCNQHELQKNTVFLRSSWISPNGKTGLLVDWFWWSRMRHICIYTCNATNTLLFILVLKCQRPVYRDTIYLKNTTFSISHSSSEEGKHQFPHKFLFWFLFCLSECKFTCASGKCLYLGSLICNQQNDCGDNSDEENCLLVTEHPPPGIFSCK